MMVVQLQYFQIVLPIYLIHLKHKYKVRYYRNILVPFQPLLLVDPFQQFLRNV